MRWKPPIFSHSKNQWLCFLLGFFACLCLGGCVNSEAVHTVEQYLHAIVSQNPVQTSNLTCESWKDQALMELNSYQLVKASLSNLNCWEIEPESGGVLVQCKGEILTSYNNEINQVDLSSRKIFVSHENGDWLVCGYQ